MSIEMKCPNCGGAVYYEPASGNMKCIFCKEEISREEYNHHDTAEASVTEQTWSPGPEKTWNEKSQETEMLRPDEYVDLNLYHCTSCGAELLLNGTEASTFCGFCGSPTIVFERLSKQLRPQKIIPFKISAEQALERIKSGFHKGRYVPKKIRDLTVEQVRGIYIPFWLYNSYIRRNMTIEVKTDNETPRVYNRDASCTFKNVTMDASLNMSNELAQRLEPYHMDELEDFEMAYLSGFYADKFSVPSNAVEGPARMRCREYLDKLILDSCPGAVGENDKGFRKCNATKKNIWERYRIQSIEYALLPAYFVRIRYEKDTQLIIVNGQTGKVIGDIPIEKSYFIKSYLINALIASMIYMIIGISCMSNIFFAAFSIIPLYISGLYLIKGISRYKKYEENRYRMYAGNMSKYVNDREDVQ